MTFNIYQVAELVSTILAIFAVCLDTRQQLLARPISLLSIATELLVYVHAGLYAKSLLSIIFLILNSYGWYQWKYGGKNNSALPVTKVGAQGIIKLMVWGMISGLVLGYILHTKTNAAFAYWDAMNALFWLIANTLLVKKKLESWIFWLMLDVSFAILCYYKGLYIFSIRFGLYIFLAVYGYRSWYQSYLSTQAQSATTGP